MSQRKYFSSVIFFLFIILLFSFSFSPINKSRAASEPASFESYCPYQEPPKNLSGKDMAKTPKLTAKGDFYFSKKNKVHYATWMLMNL